MARHLRWTLGVGSLGLLALHTPAAWRAADRGTAACVAPLTAAPAFDVARAEATAAAPLEAGVAVRVDPQRADPQSSEDFRGGQ